MAGCYTPEADELHRRWLPREIFADIGIADTEHMVPIAAAIPPAATVSMEQLAAQLVDLLGTQKHPAPPPPRPAALVAPWYYCSPHGYGLDGVLFATYDGINPFSAWPVPSNCSMPPPPPPFINCMSNVPADYSMFPPPPPSPLLMPPLPPVGTIAPRNGTGVFIPRTNMHRHVLPPAAARGVTVPPPNPSAALPVQPQPNGAVASAAAVRPQQQPIGRKQQRKKAPPTADAAAGHASPASEAALALLPKEWSY